MQAFPTRTLSFVLARRGDNARSFKRRILKRSQIINDEILVLFYTFIYVTIVLLECFIRIFLRGLRLCQKERFRVVSQVGQSG